MPLRVHNHKTYKTIVMTSFTQTFGKNENNVISFLLSRSFVWIFIIFGRKLLKLLISKHTYRIHRKGPLTWMYVQLSGHYIQVSGHYIQLSGHNCVQITGHMVHKKLMSYNMHSLRELHFVYIITLTIDLGIRQSQSQLLK